MADKAKVGRYDHLPPDAESLLKQDSVKVIYQQAMDFILTLDEGEVRNRAILHLDQSYDSVLRLLRDAQITREEQVEAAKAPKP